MNEELKNAVQIPLQEKSTTESVANKPSTVKRHNINAHNDSNLAAKISLAEELMQQGLTCEAICRIVNIDMIDIVQHIDI